MIKNKKGFTPYELVIGLLIISIFVYLLYSQYKKLEFQANAIITKLDLKNLNLAVKIFQLKYNRLPKNLYELKKSNCLIIKGTPIISNKSFFKNKILFDPFGNPYIYDNTTGKVKLSEKTLKLL